MPVKLEMENPVVKAWILSHQVFNSLIKLEEAAFAASGLTPQKFLVLMAIKDMPEPVTQIDVCEWLDRNPNTTTIILGRMEKDGLIKRTRDLPDRRAIRLGITSKGEKLFKEGLKLVSGVIANTMGSLSDREMRSFIRVMEKVQDLTYLKRRLEKKIRAVESIMGELMPIFGEEKLLTAKD